MGFVQGDVVRGLRIGDLARRAGVTLRTLRYYESLGMLAPMPRRPGGFRFYDESVVQRLERIAELKELLGFSLDEVRSILASEDAMSDLRARWQATDDCTERLALVQAASLQVRRQIALVAQKQERLAAMRLPLEDRLRRYRDMIEEMEPS